MTAPPPQNLCRACGKDFAGISYFERHRVGTHEYSYSEGLRMEPPREDGRRCLDTAELIELGFEQDRHGRWRDPAPAARIAALKREGLFQPDPPRRTASEG